MTFIPGLELSRLYFVEVVRPLLDAHFPGLIYDAARIGTGSEVQGFDDATSTDHDWGPRLQIFLPDLSQVQAIDAAVDAHLPSHFMGYPTRFTLTTEGETRRHRITFHTVESVIREGLATDLPLSPVEWVTCGDQALRELTGGAVFHDGLGALPAARKNLAYYPHDVWLYLMAGMWQRIGQEEHLMGRAGSRTALDGLGAAIGSALIASRLVRDIMRLAFLIERVYAPYPKWFGTAFAGLACAPGLMPYLRGALTAPTWQEHEKNLVPAYEHLARLHNALGVTEPVSESVSPFHERPFRVINAGTIAAALHAAIRDPQVKALHPMLGGINAISDSTDVLSYPTVRARARAIWGRG